MKKKTAQVTKFIKGMHEFIMESNQLRIDTSKKTEKEVQTEIRPIIIRYLEIYFQNKGYKDYVAKANKSFYWEGQEGQFGKCRPMTFAARNYPDFIIEKPYLIAVEYKQSPNGSTIKQGIGASANQ